MKTSLFFTLVSPFMMIICGCQAQEAQLSTQEVQNYLDGRPLVVSEHVVTEMPAEGSPGDKIVKTTTTGQPITMTTRTLVMNKANISALSLGKATRVSDAKWITPVEFLYQDGANRNAVEAMIEHSVSDGKILFLGFQVRKIAKQ
jgi:hypothetical protein